MSTSASELKKEWLRKQLEEHRARLIQHEKDLVDLEKRAAMARSLLRKAAARS